MKQDNQWRTAVWSWLGEPSRNHGGMALGLGLGRCSSRLDTARGQRLGGAITPTPLCLRRPIRTISCASSLHGPCSSLEFPASRSKQQTAPRLSGKRLQAQINEHRCQHGNGTPNRLQGTGKRGPRRWKQTVWATTSHTTPTLSLLVLATKTWLD